MSGLVTQVFGAKFLNQGDGGPAQAVVDPSA